MTAQSKEEKNIHEQRTDARAAAPLPEPVPKFDPLGIDDRPATPPSSQAAQAEHIRERRDDVRATMPLPQPIKQWNPLDGVDKSTEYKAREPENTAPDYRTTPR